MTSSSLLSREIDRAEQRHSATLSYRLGNRRFGVQRERERELGAELLCTHFKSYTNPDAL